MTIPFAITDVDVLRQRARDHIEEGAVTAGYAADRQAVLGRLDQALATRSHAEYLGGVTLTEMIKENLVAERIAIDSYRDFIRYVGDKDPTTRRLLEAILAVEEEHADDLTSLLRVIPQVQSLQPAVAH